MRTFPALCGTPILLMPPTIGKLLVRDCNFNDVTPGAQRDTSDGRDER
jgi:hypothetical protein